MKKQHPQAALVLIAALCLVLAGGGFLLSRIYRLHQDNQQLEAQFAREQEESRETIDRLREQEAELDTDIRNVSEELEDAQKTEESIMEEPQNAVPSVTLTPAPILVDILDYCPGDVIPEENLYMENPGIYFTASEILNGDEIYQRISEETYLKNKLYSLEELRYLKLLYYNQDGEIQVGDMVVSAEISREVLDGCLELFRQKTRVSSITLDDGYWTGTETWMGIKEKFRLER